MVGELEESELGNRGEDVVVGGGFIGGEGDDGRRGGSARGEGESGRWQTVEEETREGVCGGGVAGSGEKRGS